jgi:hypothetical protein
MRHLSSNTARSAALTLTVIPLILLGLPHGAIAKEVCVKIRSGEVVCGELVAKPQNSRTPSQPATSNGAAVEKDGMRFQSGGCKRIAKDELICGALVTNLGEEGIKPLFSTDTRVIEVNGNAVKAEFVYQGSEKGTASTIYEYIVLDPGVPTVVKFKFKGVSKDVNSLSALSVAYQINGKSTTVAVRNIAIK